MASIGIVEATLRLKDEFSSQLRRANNSLDKSTKAMRSNSEHAAAAGKRMLGFVAATYGITRSIGIMSDFGHSMSGVRAVVRASEQDMARLTAQARQLGATTQFTASQAASAMENLGRAGLKANSIAAAMPTALNLAAAASMELQRAADLTAKTMASFQLDASEANQVADVFAAAAANANTNVEGMGDAMRYAGPAAKAFGYTVAETAAGLGVLSDAGLTGSMAGTGLRRVLSELAAPTKQATAALKNLGIDVKDLNPATHSLVEIVAVLKEANLDAATAFTVFGDRGAAAALNLALMHDRLVELTDITTNSAGEAKRMADTVQDNLWGSLKRLVSILDELILSIEDGMNGALRDGVDGLVEMLAALKEVAKFIGSVLGAALNVLAEAFKVVSENVEVFKVWLTALIAVKVYLWAMTSAAGVAKLNIAFVAAVVAATLLVDQLVKMQKRAQAEINKMVADSERAGRAFKAMQGARRQLAAGAETAVVSTADAEAMWKRVDELRKRVSGLNSAIAKARRDLGESGLIAEAYVAATGKLKALEEQARTAQMEMENIRKVLGRTEEGLTLPDTLPEEKKKPAPPGVDAAAEAVRELTKRLQEQARVHEFLRSQLAETGRNYEVAERRAEAFSVVLGAGIDPAKRIGKELYEAALKGLEFADSVQRNKAALKEMEDAVEAVHEKFLEFAKARAASTESAALSKARAFAQGFVDIGKLREEVDWEKKRLAATKEGKTALLEWAVAKAKADYVARSGATAEMVADFERLTRELMSVRGEIEDVGKGWAEINKGFQQAVGSALFDAATGFFAVMEEGLINDLPPGVQAFAKSLLDAANAWLAQMLANIVKAAAAATAAKIGQGGKGGDSWGGSFMNALGLGGGGGTGMAMSGAAMGGLAFAAVAVAALAVMKHQSDQRDKRRYGTNVQVRTEDGAMAGYMGGRLTETGGKMRDAMIQLATALQDSTRAVLEGTNSAVISLRNDKKAFIAKLNGELIGVFRTAEEAVIAVVKEQFLRQSSLDPIIRQVLENYRGADPAQLAANVKYVQDIVDAVSGLTEMEATLQKLPGQISAMVGSLQQMGIAFQDAAVLAGRWGLEQFRGAWNQISGRKESPKEERETKERQRALILAQMKLERARLAGEIETLRARMKIAAAGTKFQQRDLAARAYMVKWEANALRNGLDIYGRYVDARAQLVGVEAEIYDEQIAALETVMKELDLLMGEIERGKINLGGAGKGSGKDLGDVVTKANGGGVSNWHQRMLDATERIRDFQKRLVLGELSPFTGRQKVEAAKAEYDRLVAQFNMGGRNKILAMEKLPEAAEQYLELFRSTMGATGAYEGEARDINAFMSQILRGAGIAPIAVMEQATANADEIQRRLQFDPRGRLEIRDEESENLLQRGNLYAERSARDLSVMVGLLEDLANNSASARAASNVPGAAPASSLRRAAGAG